MVSSCRVGPGGFRSEITTHFSNNLQEKTIERKSAMWTANNPFSNRQVPKRNHEKVDYQNEKDPLPKLLFHFGSPPSPIFPRFLNSGLFLAFPPVYSFLKPRARLKTANSPSLVFQPLRWHPQGQGALFQKEIINKRRSTRVPGSNPLRKFPHPYLFTGHDWWRQ